MKNNKGFTLVELLAMLVVLGIIMTIAVPNITGIMKNNRLNGFKDDAKQMIERTNIMVSKTKSIKKPQSGECLIFTLDYLNTNDDLTAGPNGGLYEQEESFVIYKRDGQKYVHYVRLIEDVDSNRVGLDYVEADSIDAVSADDIEGISTVIGISKNNDKTTNLELIKADSNIQNICGENVKDFFIRN